MAGFLALAGIDAKYESFKIPYTQPEKSRTYTPDFLLPNGIVLETKGLFDAADRAKMLLVKAQHPDLDIRLVFSNAKAKVTKGSATTYAMWCEKHGFLWANKIPCETWLTEPSCPIKQAAVKALIPRA